MLAPLFITGHHLFLVLTLLPGSPSTVLGSLTAAAHKLSTVELLTMPWGMG